MKKHLGSLLLLVLAFIVAPFCMYSAKPVKAMNTDLTVIDDLEFNIANTFGEIGIFILKSSVVSDNETYDGTVAVTSASGALSRYNRFKYQTVCETPKEGGGTEWSKTNFLYIDKSEESEQPIGEDKVNYHLIKTAPVGKYGISVTAYNRDDETGAYFEAYEGDQVVSTVFVIVYGESLSSIHCNGYVMGEKAYSNSTYNVRERGNGLGKTISISISVNPGAIYNDGIAVSNINDQIGNLADYTAVGVSNVLMEVMNSRGQVLEWGVISTLEQSESIKNGMIHISLPYNLAVGAYVLRIWHLSDPEIYASFVIDNGGGAADAGDPMGVMGTILLILGLLAAAGGGVLFLWPKLIIFFQETAAERQEKSRLKKAGVGDKKVKEQESKSAYETVKAITKELEESENLSEAKRNELLKKRSEEYEKTKTGGFLQKLHDNRMRREFARDSGMSLEEFKEAEAKEKAMEDAKQKGLSQFRTGDDEDRIITQQQVEKVEEAAKEEETKRRANIVGDSEFELLESVKLESEYREAAGTEKTDLQDIIKTHEAAKEEVEKEKGSGLLDRLKKFTGEE